MYFRNLSDRLSAASFSNGTSRYSSIPFGILDFYESLAVIPNLYSLILQSQSELKADLRPAGPV